MSRLTVGLRTVPLPALCVVVLATTHLSAQFDHLHFRNIGPATPSGRIDDFAVLERNPAVFYVAAATGGLWKTMNAGTTFESVFDKESSVSIGDVAIAPNDANVVWVGTGENNNRQSSSWGDGVYKSTDGGKSWKNMGLRETKHIARIIVDPVDHDVVYVAALGSLWGPGGERGIYKTGDGGLTWNRVLDAGPDAGATELVMDPTNNKTIYAATYQRRRSSWGFNGGGPASAMYKSTDAGRSWTKLTKGIPEGSLGRIGIDVYRRNPDIVYARIEHPKEGGVYRSDDGGASWTKMSSQNPRPMYFSQIRIDPTNDQRIYVLGTPLLLSDDGGKTFNSDAAKRIHVDFHAMWIDPNNSDHLMIGGDGGVGVSRDRSKSYMWLPNLPVGQFYHVGFDNQTPFNVCGGLQDNNTWCGPSAVRSKDGIANDDWFVAQGGDGFVGVIDPNDSKTIYAESQDGFVARVDRTTNERKTIRPEAPEGEKSYRWNWDTPMMLSPHDAATIFVGANRLFKSTDRGQSWKVVSPDLTTATDRDTVDLMGAKGKDIKIAKNDGIEAYGTLFTIAESRLKKGVYYTGSDDGQLYVSKDDGGSWTNLSSKVPGAPKNAYVSKVEPSKFAEGTVYVSYDGHRTNDFGTYLYSSIDYGSSWKSIGGGLRGQVVRSVTEDLKNPDVLYAGTESGLFASTDRGSTWVRVKANLPTVPVYEITIHPRDNAMILATHGRVVWILDDLTPFQEYAKAQATDAFVFQATPIRQRNPAEDRMREFEGDMRFLGENPAGGATINFHLKKKADSVRIAIRDASGAAVRGLADSTMKLKTEPGVQFVTWDLRVEPVPPTPGQRGGGFFGGGLEGPLVLPGDYTAVLWVNGKESGSTTVTVRGDLELTVSAADRKTHFEVLKDVHTLHSTIVKVSQGAKEANDALTKIKAELKDSAAVPASIRATLDSLMKQLDSIKPKFGLGGDPESFDFSAFRKNLTIRTGFLKGAIMGSTSLPTESQMQEVQALKKAIPAASEEVNALINRMPAFYKQLAQAGLYPAAPKPIKAP